MLLTNALLEQSRHDVDHASSDELARLFARAPALYTFMTKQVRSERSAGALTVLFATAIRASETIGRPTDRVDVTQLERLAERLIEHDRGPAEHEVLASLEPELWARLARVCVDGYLDGWTQHDVRAATIVFGATILGFVISTYTPEEMTMISDPLRELLEERPEGIAT